MHPQRAKNEGLRERKKRTTRRALTTVARQLVADRGLDDVTVAEIAATVDVSERTFFNYFACKEEAIVGVEPAVLADLARDLGDHLDHLDPVAALRAVLLLEIGTDGAIRNWELRNELVHRYPALLPRHLESMVQVEAVLADVVADHLGIDPAVDPTPRVIVASTLAALRTTLAWWHDTDRTVPLADILDATLPRHLSP